MRVIEATITSQGQVTLPAEVRRHLGLAKPGKVTFLIEEGGSVRLVPARFTLASAFGSVEPLPHQSSDFDREIEEAMADYADDVVQQIEQP